MRKILSLSLLSCVALGLVGCRTLVDPTFMPAGYSYHHDEYKAPPGPEADDIGYEYSAAKNGETLAIWRIAVVDLIDQMEEQNAVGPQDIYVHRRARHNAFNASYDHVLREELRGRGYTLSTYPGSALALWYEAHEPVDQTTKNMRHYNGDVEQTTYAAGKASESIDRDFVLILTLTRDNALFGKAAGVYKLPGYGYQEDPGIELKLPKVVAGDVQ